MQPLDERSYRNALATFTTGVAIVSAIDQDELPIAMTINSFASVSLHPPKILWSIDNNSRNFDTFTTCTHFSVHILHTHQANMANSFAQKCDFKFDTVPWHRGINKLPILEDFHTCFQCQTDTTYSCGDHYIIVGTVLEYDDQSENKQPLIFYKSGYHNLSI